MIMSINKTGLTTLLINITSPADGTRVEGSQVTVSGTASAHRESLTSSQIEGAGTLGPLSEPKPSVKPPSDGAEPDELVFPSAGSGDSSLTDLTGQINQVRVSIHTGPTPSSFQAATPTGRAGREWETWTAQLSLPQPFRQATITAEVILGSNKEATSIRISQFRFAGELVTGN
jgi:hypothetical protein